LNQTTYFKTPQRFDPDCTHNFKEYFSNTKNQSPTPPPGRHFNKTQNLTGQLCRKTYIPQPYTEDYEYSCEESNFQPEDLGHSQQSQYQDDFSQQNTENQNSRNIEGYSSDSQENFYQGLDGDEQSFYDDVEQDWVDGESLLECDDDGMVFGESTADFLEKGEEIFQGQEI
jgi:hypothetical protein